MFALERKHMQLRSCDVFLKTTRNYN